MVGFRTKDHEVTLPATHPEHRLNGFKKVAFDIDDDCRRLADWIVRVSRQQLGEQQQEERSFPRSRCSCDKKVLLQVGLEDLQRAKREPRRLFIADIQGKVQVVIALTRVLFWEGPPFPGFLSPQIRLTVPLLESGPYFPTGEGSPVPGKEPRPG